MCYRITSVFVEQNKTHSEFSNADSWVILSEIEQSIKRKIEAIGTPLKDWDIQINYGIKTGLNDAFIITTEKRNEILSNCRSDEERSRTEEIIRPILRGRDIKRYSYDWGGLYLVWVPWHFPLHLDNTIQGASEVAEKAFQIQYPSVYQHLLQYKPQLAARNKAETGIRYEWYALQRWGANYWEDFQKPKLVYNDIAQHLSFALSINGEFLNNTAYFISAEDLDLLKYLQQILNSTLMDWYYRTISVQLGEKAVRMFSIYVLKIPIPKRVDIITTEDEVFRLYGLSTEEICYLRNH